MNTPPHELPWNDLARWFANQMSPDEAERFASWVKEDAERAALVASLREAWNTAGAATEGWDASAAVRRVREHASHRSGVRVLAMTSRRAERSASHRRFAWALTAAAIILLVTGITYTQRRSTAPAPVATVEYRAASGQRTILQLSDGTQVTLAPGTTLRRRADYGIAARRLELEGEAYFVVAHDSTRPFRVVTRGLVARDIGTRFVVRAYAGDSATTVVVAEGKVAVAPAHDTDITAGREALLGAGDAGTLRSGTIMRAHGVSVDDALAWTTGHLVFRDAPLSEVISRLARWYDADIRIDPSARALRVTGSFVDESAADVLDAVARSVGLRLHRQAGTYQLSRSNHE